MAGIQNWQKAAVLNHLHLASTFHYFIFEGVTPLIYQPGQYLCVKVAEDRVNNYSIAGSEGNKFFFLINTAPGGPGSKFFENLKAGEEISYLGPFGTFIFRENDGAKHILFLATGAGLAPFKAILEDILPRRLGVPITLYFGLTSNKDLFWQDYLKNLKQQYPNFDYKIVIWKPEKDWQGSTGFITDQAKKDFPDMKNFSAYLSGHKIMVTEARIMLQSQGLKKERIYTETQ